MAWFPFRHKEPYTNYHDLNLDYFIGKFEEIFTEWETLYNTLNSWKDDTTAELEEWKTSVENDLDDRETALRAELTEWKTQTETNISTWETATLTALDAWKTATTAIFEAIRVEAAGSATAAANSATAAEAAQTSAENAATSISESAAEITKNTNNIADIKNAIKQPYINWTIGSTISNDGQISANNPTYALTDIIQCNGGDSILIKTPEKDDNNIYFVAYIATYGTTVFANDTFIERIAAFANRNIKFNNNVTGFRIAFGRTSESGIDFVEGDLSYWDAFYYLKTITYQDYTTIIKPAISRSQANALIQTGIKEQYTIHIKDFISGEYYDTTTGAIGIDSSNTYKRSKFLIPCNEAIVISSKIIETNAYHAYVVFYDENLMKINSEYNSLYNGTSPRASVSPKGTKYIGFDLLVSEEISDLDINYIINKTSYNIEYPLDKNNKDYKVIENSYITSGGALESTSGYCVIVLPNPRCSKIYTNINISNQLYIHDSINDTIIEPVYSLENPYGRLYTIPDSADIVYLTYSLSLALDVDGNPDMYYSFVDSELNDSVLNGKKIICIGDSITYIDGIVNSGTGSIGRNVGYQSELRKRGAIVNSIALDGRSYAQHGTDPCIYDTIVTNTFDFTGYDYIVLFGGANDVRLSINLGTVPSAYDNISKDPTTFAGAISGIIDYIQTNYPNCKIFICTTLQSQDSSRNFAKNKAYRDTIISDSEFWSIPYIDMFTEINANPTTNWSVYFYDTTHPNSRGMKNVGNIIAEKLILY